MRHVFLPVVGLLVVTGCYTVLRHPRVESPNVEAAPVVLRSDCAACHSDWDLHRYGYAFHPGWYPVYGPWPRWYSEPWWIDVAATDPHPASAGVQVEQSAGLKNDRESPPPTPAPGVWMPGSGTATTSPRGSIGPQAPGSQASSPAAAGRGGNPAGESPRPGTDTAPTGPQPGQQVDSPRSGPSSQPARDPHGAEATSNPRGKQDTADKGPQPSGGRNAVPSPVPPKQAAPPSGQRESQSQGRGMTNDRGGPKP